MALGVSTIAKATRKRPDPSDDKGPPAKRLHTTLVPKAPDHLSSILEDWDEPSVYLPEPRYTSDASETTPFEAQIRPSSQAKAKTPTARLREQVEKLQAEVHDWRNMFKASEKLRIGNETRHREEVELLKVEHERKYAEFMKLRRVEKERLRTLSAKHEVLRASDTAREAAQDTALIEAAQQMVKDATARRDARQSLKIEREDNCKVFG